MALEDWLLPNENVRFNARKAVDYGGITYDFYLTNERVMLHNRKGVLIKKEAVIAERLEDITSMDYKEKGVIKKKGRLIISTNESKSEWEGKPAALKAIWHQMQHHTRK